MSRLLYALIFLIALTQVVWSQTTTVADTKIITQAGPAQSSRQPNSAEDCACESQVLPEALAIVNGVRITRQDVERATKEPVTQLQREFVDARKRELALQINSKLLTIEAKRRGISTTKLLEEEVIAKVKEPTDVEVQIFYDQNKTQIPGDFKAVKEDVRKYLRDQRQQQEAKQLADRLRKAIETKVLVPEVTPLGNEAEPGRVLATVNGEPITSDQIEDSLRRLLFDVQERVYKLRKAELDFSINDTLLEQEAQRRRITTNALLDAEIKPRTVVEDEARVFYEQNQSRVSGDFTQTKDAIIRYLQQIELRKAERAFVEKLRAAASIQILLLSPEPPVFSILTSDQPSLGNEAAPVTIVEFTDFQCPSCAATHPTLERLVKEYADKVRLVALDFPLSQHSDAFKAAEAAEAAREQGKYWEFVQILMRNQSALGIAKLKDYATEIALDRARFDQALESAKFANAVQRDIDEGMRLGINSTPTIFINGRRVSDNDYDALKANIETILKTLASKTAAQVNRRIK